MRWYRACCLEVTVHQILIKLLHFLDVFFIFLNLSFKIQCSKVWGWALSLLVNLFSKLYVTFILHWIAFIFSRDEEEDQ